MNSNIISRIAMIVFALVFVPFGINHLLYANGMAGMVPIPGGAIWVYITGAGFLLASIAIIINLQVKLACYLLGLMLLTIAISVHLIPFIRGVDAEMHLSQFYKDMGLATAAFFIGSKSK